MDINQVSLTGVRGIVLLALLIDAPRSLQEIRQAYLNLKIMEPEHSDDIIRIDINTLKASGCDITREKKKTGYKFTLLSHPFSLKLTMDEVNLLKKVYNRIKNRSGIELMLKYDELFRKLASYVDEQEIKEKLYGISILKNYNIDFVKELLEDCEEKRVLTLIYKNPTAKEESQKDISAQKLVLQNDNIHLYGYDFDKKRSIVLNIKRIKSIITRYTGLGKIEAEIITVKFLLKNSGKEVLEENEQIIETTDDGIIVEGKYYNDFIAAQRILSFGANCIVYEPEDFKQDIIQKLKSMRRVYNG